MKNVICTLAVVLALTSVTFSAPLASDSQAKKITTKSSAHPTPMCPFDQPDACGIGQ